MPEGFTIEFEPLQHAKATFRPSGVEGYLPLQQHPCYGLSLAEMGAVPEVMTVKSAGHSPYSALVLDQRFIGLARVKAVFRAPLPDGENAEVLQHIRRQFAPWRWRFFTFMPECKVEQHGTMRRAGYRRIMTGASTIWVDLRKSPADLRASLLGKWRNQLKKAEGEPLTVSVGGRKPKHYNWLLEKEAEQRSASGYAAIPLGLVPIYARVAEELGEQSGASVVSVSAYHKGQPVAGALFLCHGASATYHIGWSGEQGRTLNAQNRVLFEGMLALKDRGISWLDMGGIETKTKAGIARFKMGLGHPVYTAAGLYLAG